VTAADVSRKKERRKINQEKDKAFVKNKRVTHRRANEKGYRAYIYNTGRKGEIERIMHSQKDSRINYLLDK
jgi:hypothetical protein